jgi:hypothetical protein
MPKAFVPLPNVHETPKPDQRSDGRKTERFESSDIDAQPLQRTTLNLLVTLCKLALKTLLALTP